MNQRDLKDILFRTILHNKLLSRLIFQCVKDSYYGRGKKYCQLNLVEWMLENGHYHLLKHKIQNNRNCLHLNIQGRAKRGHQGEGCELSYLVRIFKIHDLNTFRVCFEYFKHYFVASPVLKWASIFGTCQHFVYLVNRGYASNCMNECLIQAIRCRNIDVVAHILANANIGRIGLGEVLEAIKIQDLNLFKKIFDHHHYYYIIENGTNDKERKVRGDYKKNNNGDQIKPSPLFGYYDVNTLLSTAAKYGTPEIFCAITEKFSSSSLNADQLVLDALDNPDMVKYVIQHYYQVAKPRPQYKDRLRERLINLAKNKRFDLVMHCVNVELFTGDLVQLATQMCIKYGASPEDMPVALDVYKRLEMADIKGVLEHVEKVIYYQELGVRVGPESVLYLCQRPHLLAVLQYLLPRYNHTAPGNHLDTPHLVNECMEYNNYEGLKYLINNNIVGQVEFKIGVYWSKVLGRFGNVPFLKLVWEQTEISNENYDFVQYAMQQAALYDQVSAYQYCFNLLESKNFLSRDNFIIEHISKLCLWGKLDLLKLLVDRGFVPDTRAIYMAAGTSHYNLLEFLYSIGCKASAIGFQNAAANNQLDNIKFLFENTVLDDPETLGAELMHNCISNRAFSVFQFLIDDIVAFGTPLTDPMAMALGHSTREIVQYFYLHPKYIGYSANEHYLALTFNTAMESGNLPVIQLLYEKHHQLLTKDNFMTAVETKYVWVMQYLKSTPLVESLKTDILKANARDQSDDYFNDYKKLYCASLKSKKFSLSNFFHKK